MKAAGAGTRRVTRLEVPLVAACWTVGYWAPWLPRGSSTAWFQAAAWGAKHGFGSLQASGLIVTIAITLCAIAGAALCLYSAAGQQPSRIASPFGLLAVCAPLCVLLPAGGAVFFLAALTTVVAVASYLGWRGTQASGATAMGRDLADVAPHFPLWGQLLHESFAILSAGCFATLSWQYNAQLLLRALLIAAGVALLIRAAFPARGQQTP